MKWVLVKAFKNAEYNTKQNFLRSVHFMVSISDPAVVSDET